MCYSPSFERVHIVTWVGASLLIFWFNTPFFIIPCQVVYSLIVGVIPSSFSEKRSFEYGEDCLLKWGMFRHIRGVSFKRGFQWSLSLSQRTFEAFHHRLIHFIKLSFQATQTRSLLLVRMETNIFQALCCVCKCTFYNTTTSLTLWPWWTGCLSSLWHDNATEPCVVVGNYKCFCFA